MKTFCHYYNAGDCGSCRWIEKSYDEQIHQKEEQLKRALSFANHLPLLKTVHSPSAQFRNKAKMSVTGTSEKPIIGILGETRLDEGRELLNCPIHHPKLNQVLARLPAYIQEFNLIPYQISKKSGELKSLILFYSEDSNEMYLRFVLRSQECVSRLRKLWPKLKTEFPFITCLSANLQPIPHAILEGADEIFISEQTFIHHQLGAFMLNLSPRGFVQTNANLATKLYQTAAEWVTDLHPEIFVELFAGQGAFSFFASSAAQKIVGVEINAAAVKTANETATNLGLNHLSFIEADAGAIDEQIGFLKPDVLLVNPPRKGIGKDGVKLILKVKPQTVIYSSCSVDSLTTDLSALASEYQVVKTQIFDLFPNTSHFETLVLISRIN